MFLTLLFMQFFFKKTYMINFLHPTLKKSYEIFGIIGNVINRGID